MDLKDQQELNDKSPMPFGMYSGQPMEKVPASYLHYLWSDSEKKIGPVFDYIRKNKAY